MNPDSAAAAVGWSGDVIDQWPTWIKFLLGLLSVIAGWFGWQKVRESRLTKIDERIADKATADAEERERDRKTIEALQDSLAEETKQRLHKAAGAEYTHSLQMKLIEERLDNAQKDREIVELKMNEMRRDHREELRIRDDHLAERQSQVDSLTRKVAELTRRLADFEVGNIRPENGK